MTEINQKLCPLCLGKNACGNTETSNTNCWCVQEKIPNDLLGKVPKTAKGRQCICQNCLENYRSEN